jgi:protein-L-isoaspartate(D-aspartate) O-methyltransferase
LEKNDWEKLIANLMKENILHSPNVIRAMRTVPRSKFLPENMQSYSAVDTPLPIGFGQTASAPHMVSIMNEALQLETSHKVLEIGAGSGWHGATIAEIVAPSNAPRSNWGHVYTVEIIQGLAEFARKNIMKAPYDRIVVTAAAPDAPKPLIDQLRPGGIILIPIGDISLFQSLVRIVKGVDGKTEKENLGGVAFVPLTGRYGHTTW